MKIKAFIITFNEADIIRLTIEHYKNICSEIYIFDNYSTDDTVAICKDLGCIVESFGTPGVLDDRSYLEVKNNCWKKHKDADYVIVCDADEILQINMEEYGNWDIHKCLGYNMYDEKIPTKSWQEVTRGYKDPMYDKMILFAPARMIQTNYGYGCHGARPVGGNLNIGIHKLNLYHMRYIGGVDRLINRYQLYYKRMCQFNLENKLGYQYAKSENQLLHEWDEVINKSFKVR